MFVSQPANGAPGRFRLLCGNLAPMTRDKLGASLVRGFLCGGKPTLRAEIVANPLPVLKGRRLGKHLVGLRVTRVSRRGESLKRGFGCLFHRPTL